VQWGWRLLPCVQSALSAQYGACRCHSWVLGRYAPQGHRSWSQGWPRKETRDKKALFVLYHHAAIIACVHQSKQLWCLTIKWLLGVSVGWYRYILVPYLFDNTPHKNRFLLCRVTAVFINIYFYPCGIVRGCWKKLYLGRCQSWTVRDFFPTPSQQPHVQQQQQQPQPQHRLLLRENSGKQAEQQLASNSLSQQAKAERAVLLAEEAANKRPIGRPEKECYGLTIWL